MSQITITTELEFEHWIDRINYQKTNPNPNSPNRKEVITATMFLWWVLDQLLFPTFTVLLERRKK